LAACDALLTIDSTYITLLHANKERTHTKKRERQTHLLGGGKGHLGHDAAVAGEDNHLGGHYSCETENDASVG